MEPIPYNGDIAWLKQRTILAVTHGSHAYADCNPKRKVLEEKCGYNCHDAETQFLTQAGWKGFDDITAENKLATFRTNDSRKDMPFGTIEYQNYTDRFDAIYSGPMYTVSGEHTLVRVTANHRMFYQKVERVSEKSHGWKLDEAHTLPDCFDFLAHCNPATRPFQNPPELKEATSIPTRTLIRLMGWYLSDGCAADKRGEEDSIRISQRPGGKLYGSMVKFSNKYGSPLYEYDRAPNEFNPTADREAVLVVSFPDVVTFINKHCGRLKEKRIPRFMFGCSADLLDVLFEGLRKGDGTIRKHETKTDSVIYYSTLPGVANDVNELAVLCGWETALYGPYKRETHGRSLDMYQVHVRKDVSQTRRLIRNNCLTKDGVVEQRIVCFTVPNGTLITRYRGYVGYHGNCKN